MTTGSVLPALTTSIDDILSVHQYMAPSTRRKRVYTAGEMLNEQSAGSAAHVQKEAAARFMNKVEARQETLLRRNAERSVEQARVTDPSHESRQVPAFLIPHRIAA